MTNVLLTLLRNRTVRIFITELCVGITVGVVATLKRKDKNEKRKRILLHMHKGSPDSRDDRSKTEMRQEDKRSKTCEERESWSRAGSSKRNYM